MRQLVYVMRFTGRATPTSHDGGVLHLTATAPGPIPITCDPDDLVAAIAWVLVDEVVLHTDMTLTGPSSFQEVGTITFGADDHLHVVTLGSGYLGASADPMCRHGAVTWRVQGEGRLAGLRGLITSNFIIGDDRSVTDHHLGVLFLP